MENAQRLPDFAEIFERVLVPALFDRYARDLVERARPFGPSDRILDLGCGTGIVARVLRERLGGAASVAGLDVNASMIARARSIAPEIAWQEGNACALPYADRSFEIVLSQQMLQFVPDREAAVREVRRVLVPGGRFIASAWKGRSGLYDELGALAEQRLGPGADKRWSLGGDELHARLSKAGFVDIQLQTASLTERYAAFPLHGSMIAAGYDAAQIATIAPELEAVVARYTQPTGEITTASTTNIVIASVP